jgi:hypothetical protein
MVQVPVWMLWRWKKFPYQESNLCGANSHLKLNTEQYVFWLLIIFTCWQIYLKCVVLPFTSCLEDIFPSESNW